MIEILKKGFTDLEIPYTDEMLCQFQRYYELLVEWNEKMNLTAITDPEGIAVKHFLDCLAYLKRANIPEGAKVADVGTGAGFPGVVLKIARPDIKLVLIDSLQKRLNFLDTVLNEIGVKATLVHARAEDAGHDKTLRESFDVVTARAVANLAVLSEYCIPLVKVGGVFAPMKTAEVAEELEGAKAAAKSRRMLPDAEIDIYTQDTHVSYSACGLPYYIQGNFEDWHKLIIRSVEEFEKNNIHIHLLNRVTKILPIDKKIIVKDLNSNELKFVDYDKLVIATGSAPRMTDFPDIKLKNIFTLRTLEDGIAIRETMQEVNNITIIGGGYISIELLEAFVKNNKNVTLIEKMPYILSVFDEDISSLIEDYIIEN